MRGDRFVLVLLGHGSFDGTDYRFNIPGEDITGAGLRALLDRFPEGVTQLVVDATSASGAMAGFPRRPASPRHRRHQERRAQCLALRWLLG